MGVESPPLDMKTFETPNPAFDPALASQLTSIANDLEEEWEMVSKPLEPKICETHF